MRGLLGTACLCLVAACAVEACVGDEPSTNGSTNDGGGSDGTAGGDASAGDGSNSDSSISDASGGDSATVQPSCAGLGAICGQLANADCCGSEGVEGGTFLRNYDGLLDASPVYADGTHSATISNFKLDDFGVSVGRYRQFVAAYPGDKPSDGAGKNPHNPDDPGWQSAWNALMPSAQVDLLTAIDGCSNHDWTDTNDGGVEAKPMNCVTWYEAFAFCIWDGGRLPTAAEFNYAQSGGAEQRVFPWSNPPYSQVIDTTYTVMTPDPTIAVVGSTPLGNGKFGQSDLVGNIEEWGLDMAAGIEAPPATCNDCANFDAGTSRVIRGGLYFASAAAQRSARTFSDPATTRNYTTGFRCARN